MGVLLRPSSDRLGLLPWLSSFRFWFKRDLFGMLGEPFLVACLAAAATGLSARSNAAAQVPGCAATRAWSAGLNELPCAVRGSIRMRQ